MNKSYNEWYRENAEKLAKSRKEKYDNDPEHRATLMARSADYRARTKVQRPPLPGMLIKDVCDTLEITPWTLNKWRLLGYYPAPERVGGHPIFYHGQIELLAMIRDFFRSFPKKSAAKNRSKLDAIVEVVAHNWSQNAN